MEIPNVSPVAVHKTDPRALIEQAGRFRKEARKLAAGHLNSAVDIKTEIADISGSLASRIVIRRAELGLPAGDETMTIDLEEKEAVILYMARLAFCERQRREAAKARRRQRVRSILTFGRE